MTSLMNDLLVKTRSHSSVETVDVTAFIELENNTVVDEVVDFDAAYPGIQATHDPLNVAQPIRRAVRFLFETDEQILISFFQYSRVVQLHLAHHSLQHNVSVGGQGDESLRFE